LATVIILVILHHHGARGSPLHPVMLMSVGAAYWQPRVLALPEIDFTIAPFAEARNRCRQPVNPDYRRYIISQ